MDLKIGYGQQDGSISILGPSGSTVGYILRDAKPTDSTDWYLVLDSKRRIFESATSVQGALNRFIEASKRTQRKRMEQLLLDAIEEASAYCDDSAKRTVRGLYHVIDELRKEA